MLYEYYLNSPFCDFPQKMATKSMSHDGQLNVYLSFPKRIDDAFEVEQFSRDSSDYIVDLIFLVISLCTLGDALVNFKLNTTSSGKLYFFLDEKWPLVEQTSQCQNRLDMAQYSCKSNNFICLILTNGKDSRCMHIENVPSTLSDILGSAHNV